MCTSKIHKSVSKTPGYRLATSSKKRLWYICFSVSFTEFFMDSSSFFTFKD